ncbi:MAG: hypothetical protein JW747_05810 [Candidatus Aminicenantes bacterium]|nr:hypothetical protein [Candidatus Aminicenantes bacterium]
MSDSRSLVQAAGLVLLALAATACFRVHVIEDCRDGEARFLRASREIERLQETNPERRGRVREICVFVHDQNEGDLIQVRTSVALFKAALSLAADIAEDKDDFDFERKYGLAWRAVRDLKRFGPGLLIAVEDEDSRVLVWMR